MKTFKFIVMGEIVEVRCPEHVMFWVPRLMALHRSMTVGRPPSDYEIRDHKGNLVHPLFPVAPFDDGSEFYLTPSMGAGGSHANHRRKNYPPIMNPIKGWRRNPTSLVGRCGARNNWHAHAKTQSVEKRIKSRQQRRRGKQRLPDVVREFV
jgi:hypothetical protein